MNITVQYPTIEITKSLAYKLYGIGKKEIVKLYNQEQTIEVKKVSKITVTSEDLTGLNAQEYQSKFGVAWNE